MNFFPHLRFGLLLALASVAPGYSDDVIRYDWGPFATSWQDVHGNFRSRFLGPVGERMQSPEDDSLFAIRPFYHHWTQPSASFSQKEFLWPIAVSRSRDDSFYTRVLLNFYWSWRSGDAASRWRLWILPFYFQGRDAKGESYMALFPLAGRIHEFFLWDRVNFALFPLYVESQLNDTRAVTWLWPIFSRTEGPRTKRFRIFPFYGYDERPGRGRKTFVLWPFWTQVRYTIPGSAGRGWILFPLAGHLKLTDQETWWLIPPIFRYSVGADGSRRIFGPWPFFQREQGHMDKFYLFPLYGHKRHAGIDRTFFLWPLGGYEHSSRDTGDKTKFFLLPFVRYYAESPPADAPGPEGESRYTKIWPLFSHLSKRGGEVRHTAVFDLNPMRGGPIERNYAPFWQIYVRSQVDDAVDTEWFWGLYRSASRGEQYRYRSLFPFFSWSREEDGGHFSLLKGLISRRRIGGENSWRVLYLFRFGAKESGK